jgi:hypothetical protein
MLQTTIHSVHNQLRLLIHQDPFPPQWFMRFLGSRSYIDSADGFCVYIIAQCQIFTRQRIYGALGHKSAISTGLS